MFLKNENKFRISRASSLGLSAILLSSVSLPTAPARADASLDELKARLERAEKENLTLKAEKLERENITMKLEKIEAENAALRNETKVDRTPTASIPSQKTTAVTTNTPSPEVKAVARREPAEASVPAPREHAVARREVNRALDNIQKDDARREMTAAYKASREEVPVVVKQWQGVYAGINGGYGYGSQYGSVRGYGMGQGYSSGTEEPNAIYTYGNTPYNGGVAGGQFGYNYQFSNNLLIGVEADVDWADINSNNAGAPSGVGNFTAGINRSNAQIVGGRTGLDWIGTARGRIGYVLGNFLPYVTAGFAYGGMSTSSNFSYLFGYNYYNHSTSYYNSVGGVSNRQNGSSVSIGWAAGAGAEYMVAPNWSLKGEYLYTQLSGFNAYGSIANPQYQSGVGYTNYAISPTVFLTNTLSPFGVHQARVGLNYHTDWLASKPAVAAKY